MVFIPFGIGGFFLISGMQFLRKKKGDKTNILFGARFGETSVFGESEEPYVQKM